MAWERDKELEEILEPNELPHHAEVSIANIAIEHGSDGEWRQNGTDLRCITCQTAHGIYVAPDMIYTGETDDAGMPILKKRY